MHTLEQIKAFTPQERNEFIDEMIRYLQDKPFNYDIRLYYEFFTDYLRCRRSFFICMEELKIPYPKKLPIRYWFTSQSDQISFLKSIKTVECQEQKP